MVAAADEDLMVRTLNLTESNSKKLDELSHQTGKTADDVANEAIVKLAGAVDDERARFERWRAALLRIEGMWKDRDDLPDFQELRGSWDRDVWSR
jgi:hypothetical protein